tara:strand:+ start:1295 stop:1693 length:399 start_codon:yes stop_codon:yes gene_type:complete
MPYKNLTNEEYSKIYREENKEYFRNYRQQHKDYFKKKNKEFKYKEDGSKTEKYYKSMKITNWKAGNMRPLPTENWSYIYEVYKETTNCMGCGKVFKKASHKCLDHDHNNGYIRGVICHKCNHYTVDVFEDMF